MSLSPPPSDSAESSQHLPTDFQAIARRVQRVAAVFAITVGTGVLIGWGFDIEPLKRIAPRLVAMNPTSAMSFIALGIALLTTRQKPPVNRIGPILGVLVCAAGVLKLIGLALGTDTGVDHLLFASKHSADNPLAPNTAATLALLGAAAAGVLTSRAAVIAATQLAAIGAFLICLVAVTGYVVGILPLYGGEAQFPMALHTAITGLVVALGVLAVHRDRAFLSTGSTSLDAPRRPFSIRLLTTTVLLLAIVLSAAFWGERQSDNMADTILQTELRKQRTMQALSLLQDAEIGQRGYLLTGDEAYLQPYTDALPKIADLQTRLKTLTTTDPVRLAHARRMDVLISAELNILGEEIALQRAGKTDDAMALVRTNRGKATMDYIRQVVGTAIAEQDKSLADEQRDQDRIVTTVRATEIFGVFLLALTAVTLLRQMNTTHEALRRANRSQAQAARAEHTANLAKSRFLAGMSHELRTPMTAVLGMCDLLLTSRQTGEQREITQILARSARALLDLLNDILDLSKIESGRLTLESTDFRLSAVLAQLHDLFTPLASKKQLTLEIDLTAGSLDAVRGDPKKLHQILANLVGNAIKFTAAGRVKVSHRQQARDDGMVWMEFAVEDTGPGISDEIRPRLFQVFEQGDVSTARIYGGSGLGLAICKRLVEAMGGSIGVESAPGHGTKFFFEVPLARGDAATIAAAESASPLEAAKSLEGRALRVLVAEDAAPSQFLITKMLTLWGHSVVAVGNGKEAVAAAAEGGWDVILMDMQMPVMDGAEAVRLIRASNGPSARCPIIALTADAIQESQQTYLDAGCDAIVTKPIEWAVLSGQIAKLIGPAKPTMSDSAPPQRARPAASAAGQIPLVDPRILREFGEALGKADMITLVNSAITSIDSATTQLMACSANDDYEGARRAGHTLKGIALQVGAAQIAEIARYIETEAPTVATIDDAARELPELAVKTATALEQLIKTPLQVV